MVQILAVSTPTAAVTNSFWSALNEAFVSVLHHLGVHQDEKVVLFLEHMNDSISYRKILKRWSSNYTLFLEIWYRLPKKVISANINNSKKKATNEPRTSTYFRFSSRF